MTITQKTIKLKFVPAFWTLICFENFVVLGKQMF